MEREYKIFEYIVERVEQIDSELEKTGEEIGNSQTVNQTISLKIKAGELLSSREELGGVLKQMNRPVKPLPTIKYITNEERG